VGNGIENNTLSLASLGWRGFWLGGEELAWTPKPTDLWRYYQTWVTRPALMPLIDQGLKDLDMVQPDLISMDLDGVDIYLVEELLQNNIRPRIWLVEYNAHFPPPTQFRVDYSDAHTWSGDDYFGAALQTYVDMMQQYGYELVCCEAEVGANAWFVLREEMDLFPETPQDIRHIYSAPRYFPHHQMIRHHRSPRTVMKILGQL